LGGGGAKAGESSVGAGIRPHGTISPPYIYRTLQILEQCATGVCQICPREPDGAGLEGRAGVGCAAHSSKTESSEERQVQPVDEINGLAGAADLWSAHGIAGDGA